MLIRLSIYSLLYVFNFLQVIDYEKPIIALGALSLIFAVILPIVGIVLCLLPVEEQMWSLSGRHTDETISQ